MLYDFQFRRGETGTFHVACQYLSYLEDPYLKACGESLKQIQVMHTVLVYLGSLIPYLQPAWLTCQMDHLDTNFCAPLLQFLETSDIKEGQVLAFNVFDCC